MHCRLSPAATAALALNAGAMMRERMFTMRLSEDESRRLDRVAAHYGVNVANPIRMLLKREDDAIGGAPEPTKAKKTPKR
jgi:hypothetical protein